MDRSKVVCYFSMVDGKRIAPPSSSDTIQAKMKIRIDNIGGIKEAALDLSGVTLVAGKNKTGKTTLAKSLYGALCPIHDLDTNVLSERYRSVALRAREWLRTIEPPNRKNRAFLDSSSERRFSRILVEELSKHIDDPSPFSVSADDLCSIASEFFPGLLKTREARLESDDAYVEKINEAIHLPDNEYLRLIYDRRFFTLFHDQLEPFSGDGGSPSIDIDGCFHAEFLGNRISKLHFEPALRNTIGKVVFLRAERNYLDLSGERYSQDPERMSLLLEPDSVLENENADISVVNDALDAASCFQEEIERIIHGHLEKRPQGGFGFVESDFPNIMIDVGNAASGAMPFAIIMRMISNGTIGKNSVLIIDEPEVDLHPEWQVGFARFLVQLNRKLGVRSLLFSHSPYFIRALEKELHASDDVEYGFYLMEFSQGRFSSRDVSNGTHRIYEQLYKPLEEL